MSNISRRDFMKTAGVMTLAVAASGVLAGCSTAADEEIKPTTAGSLTVDDYTVTVDAVKLYDYNSTKKGETTPDNAKKAPRFLVFTINVASTKDNAEKTVAKALENVKLSVKNIGDYDSTKLTVPTTIYKAAFGYETAAAEIAKKATALPTTATPYSTKSGVKYCYIAAVDSYGYEDATTYKTPSITLYTQKDASVTGSISVTVPAAETIYEDSKIFDE